MVRDSDLDTDTVLNQSEVPAYVDGPQPCNWYTGNGSDVARCTFNGYLPSDFQTETMTCSLTGYPGEIIGYNGNSWICVSDNTLSASDLQSI